MDKIDHLSDIAYNKISKVRYSTPTHIWYILHVKSEKSDRKIDFEYKICNTYDMII